MTNQGNQRRNDMLYMIQIIIYLMKLILIFVITISFLGCENKNSKTPHTTVSFINIKNKEAASLNSVAIELSKNGKFEESDKILLKALDLEPNSPVILSNLGINCYYNENNLKAIEYFEESYKISDSTYHPAAINLALSYSEAKKYQNGIDISTYVIKHAKDNISLSSARIHRALNYILLKECNKAKIDLEFIIQNYRNQEGIENRIKHLREAIEYCEQQNNRIFLEVNNEYPIVSKHHHLFDNSIKDTNELINYLTK